MQDFAAGLPNLQLLVAEPSGVWGPTPAVFKHLESVCLELCGEGFAGAHLAKLFPAVRRFMLETISPGGPEDVPSFNVAGMSVSTHYGLHDPDYHFHKHPDTLTAIASLPRLQQLSIDISYLDCSSSLSCLGCPPSIHLLLRLAGLKRALTLHLCWAPSAASQHCALCASLHRAPLSITDRSGRQ